MHIYNFIEAGTPYNGIYYAYHKNGVVVTKCDVEVNSTDLVMLVNKIMNK